MSLRRKRGAQGPVCTDWSRANFRPYSVRFLTACSPILFKAIETGRNAVVQDKTFNNFDDAIALYEEAIQYFKCALEDDMQPGMLAEVARKVEEYTERVKILHVLKMSCLLLPEQGGPHDSPRGGGGIAGGAGVRVAARKPSSTDSDTGSDIASSVDNLELVTHRKVVMRPISQFPEEDEFVHRNFEIPQSEVLVTHFSISFGDSQLFPVMGRMYITKNYLCIWTKSDKILVPMKSIIQIEKKNTLLSGRCEVITTDTTLVLKNVFHRNVMYDELVRLWQESKVIFGIPLEELLVREGRNSYVPWLVEQCVDVLTTSKAIVSEGIFRLAPSKKTQVDLIDKLNKGVNVRLNDYSVDDVAGLLKRFLRDLPNPVMTVELYPQFIGLWDNPSQHERLQGLKELISKLPIVYRILLQYLCGFLSDVAEHKASNRMDKRNLATIFSPILLHSAEAAFDDLLKETATASEIVLVLLENHADIFAQYLSTPPTARP
mmetsp:Transcript_14866/g.37755  ORF Transcript_14866/g.37755 Transcript_14866/m.37755 type:complete len:490 (-) Transcript_14866:13-1482(-)